MKIASEETEWWPC